MANTGPNNNRPGTSAHPPALVPLAQVAQLLPDQPPTPPPTPTPTGPATSAPTSGKGSKKAKYDADVAAKEEVRQKLLSKDYSTILIDEDKKDQSLEWQKFEQVVDESGKPLKFVRCRNVNCRLIKMLTSGRGNLANHECQVKSLTKDPPSEVALKDFRSKLSQLCIGKLLPIRTVGSAELRAVIQAAIDIGADCGHISVNDIIPCSNTTTTDIKHLADKARAFLVDRLKEDVEDGLVSGTVDCWTENCHKRKLLGNTLRHITEEFELNDHLLFMSHCNAKSVDHVVLKQEIESNMARFQLTTEKAHYVSDDGADIVKALEFNSRSYCMDHALNLCVKKALQPQLTKLDLYG
ncbi:hypothetical protein FOCC_FOCC015734 [Frankliniella occidentalis]|nr:hypothetical protein FOCC_FOCC015734 [Frankliniella occidentalis]